VKRDGRASVLRVCSILDAPSDLGLRRTGIDGLPDARLAAGLLEGLPDVRYAGRLAVPPAAAAVGRSRIVGTAFSGRGSSSDGERSRLGLVWGS
jgi:hypothetical protein